MTVAAVAQPVSYVASGSQATFTIPWRFLNAVDILVYIQVPGASPVLQSSSTYTLAGLANPGGGTVTFNGGNITAGYNVILFRNPNPVQDTDLQNQGSYDPTSVEQQFDLDTMSIQALATQIAQSIRIPINEGTTTLLPSASQRANLFQAYDSAGNAIVTPGPTSGVPISTAMQPVVQATSLTAAAAIFGVEQQVLNVASLRLATQPTLAGILIATAGYAAAADGGQSVYVWNSADTRVDNGGSIIQVAGVVTGRFNLLAVNQLVNVKQFGATGNGITDDTAAIQAAITWANAITVSTLYTAIYDGNYPEVIFPQGLYKVSSTINYYSYLMIRGNRAQIIPSMGGYVFAPSSPGPGYRLLIDGISFIGGSAIQLNNNNVNSGQLTIRNCIFLNCATAIDNTCQSSIVTITGCIFYNCFVVLNNNACDYCVLDNCWISSGTPTANQQASINNYGRLVMREILLVPSARGIYTETAWINNYYSSTVYVNGGRTGAVLIDACRFGGETGSMTAVNNFATTQTGYPISSPTEVIILNSDCFSLDGGTSSSCIIRLFHIPNLCRMKNNVGLVDTWPIQWGSTAVPATEVAASALYATLDLDNQIQPGVINGAEYWANAYPYQLNGLIGTSKVYQTADFTHTINVSQNGWTFTSTYGGGLCIYNLPVAQPGIKLRFRRQVAFTLRMQPQAADKIFGCSNVNMPLDITTINIGVELSCTVAGVWDVMTINSAYSTGLTFN